LSQLAGDVNAAEMRAFFEDVMKPDSLWDWVPAVFRAHVSPGWRARLEAVLLDELFTGLKPFLEAVPSYGSLGEALQALKKHAPKAGFWENLLKLFFPDFFH
jgi:hypothetical protein